MTTLLLKPDFASPKLFFIQYKTKPLIRPLLGTAIGGPNTTQPFYNTVHYNTVLYITGLKDVSQKCIEYIEKWP